MASRPASRPFGSIGVAAAFGLGLALAWPGVAVRAADDLAPPAHALTGLDAPAPAPAGPAPAGDACAGSDPTRAGNEYDARRAQLAAVAKAMEDQEPGEFVVLDGRGYGYFPERNPALELARLQREAAEQARGSAPAPPSH